MRKPCEWIKYIRKIFLLLVIILGDHLKPEVDPEIDPNCDIVWNRLWGLILVDFGGSWGVLGGSGALLGAKLEPS